MLLKKYIRYFIKSSMYLNFILTKYFKGYIVYISKNELIKYRFLIKRDGGTGPMMSGNQNYLYSMVLIPAGNLCRT